MVCKRYPEDRAATMSCVPALAKSSKHTNRVANATLNPQKVIEVNNEKFFFTPFAPFNAFLQWNSD